MMPGTVVRKGPSTYVLLAHSHPDAVLRLAGTILAEVPESRIVVHYSASSGLFPDSGDARIVAVENPATVTWGTFSQTDMMLRSLAQIRKSRLPDEWIVMLSGQCYPVRPLAELEQMLAESQCDALLWCKRIDAGDHVLRDRYAFNYRKVADGPLPFPFNVRFVRGALNRIQPFVRVKSMPRVSFVGTVAKRSIFDLVPNVYFGSCWIALSRTAANYVMDIIERRPELLDMYRRTISAEESFFSTILMNAPEIRVKVDDLHFIDWSTARTGSPRTLGLEDLPAIDRSNRWFARKVDCRVEDGFRDALDARRVRDRRQIVS